MSIYGDAIDGRQFQDSRKYSMSETVPPINYRWHHNEMRLGMGNDVVASQYNFKEELREVRLGWLDQFILEVTEEGVYRYWRWYTGGSGQRKVVWWERRLLSDPLPKTPGFWPSDD